MKVFSIASVVLASFGLATASSLSRNITTEGKDGDRNYVRFAPGSHYVTSSNAGWGSPFLTVGGSKFWFSENCEVIMADGKHAPGPLFAHSVPGSDGRCRAPYSGELVFQGAGEYYAVRWFPDVSGELLGRSNTESTPNGPFYLEYADKSPFISVVREKDGRVLWRSEWEKPPADTYAAGFDSFTF